MAYAGSTGPKPDRIGTNPPDAFHLISSSLANSSSETSAADARYPVHWRDFTCSFEYNFGDGDKMNVRAGIHSSMVSDGDLQNQDELIWSLHHQLRSDPRRAFSFGVTADGTRLHV